MAIVNTRITDIVPNEKIFGNQVNIHLAAVNELVST